MAIDRNSEYKFYIIENKKDNKSRYGYKMEYKEKEFREIIKNHSPVITLNDINSYEWNRQYLFLDKNGWERMYSFINSKKRKDYEILFAVSLHEKPIYYGFLIHTYIAAYPLQPWIYYECFSKKRYLRGENSFLIGFNYYQVNKVDPRFSLALYKTLCINQKIMSYNSKTISIIDPY